MVSMVVLVIALIPAAKTAYSFIGREQAFPLLIDFSSSWYKNFISTNHAKLTVVKAPDAWQAAAGKLVAKVTLDRAKYPGIEFADLHPDWSGFSYFTLKIYSSNPAPFRLVVRIHDEKHNFKLNDRFNRRLIIVPGENVVRIPLKTIRTAPLRRDLDMQAVKALILFAPRVHGSLEFYLSDIRLN